MFSLVWTVVHVKKQDSRHQMIELRFRNSTIQKRLLLWALFRLVPDAAALFPDSNCSFVPNVWPNGIQHKYNSFHCYFIISVPCVNCGKSHFIVSTYLKKFYCIHGKRSKSIKVYWEIEHQNANRLFNRIN